MQAARKKAKLRRHTAERKASAAAAAAAGFPAGDGAGRGLADDIPVTVKTSWFMKVISSMDGKDDGKLFKLTHRLGDEVLLLHILRHFRSNKYNTNYVSLLYKLKCQFVK